MNRKKASPKFCSNIILVSFLLVVMWVAVLLYFQSNKSINMKIHDKISEAKAAMSSTVIMKTIQKEFESADLASKSLRMENKKDPVIQLPAIEPIQLKPEEDKKQEVKTDDGSDQNENEEDDDENENDEKSETDELEKNETMMSSEDDEMHIVFSTDCSFYQDWQTLLVFNRAVTIKQKGKITRIASGCPDEKKKYLINLYKKLYPQYSVHFTPDFKRIGKEKKKYDFYNKPYGLHHWLTNSTNPVKSGTIIALIDPDMIFLRPLTTTIRGNKNNIYYKGFNPDKETVPIKVEKGQPAAQLYGLGAPWTYEHEKNFNKREVCGEGSPCLNVTAKFGEQHYSVGPPYLVERDDMVKLTEAWTKFCPIVYKRYPELLAEMYAYSMAAAHVNLPHFTMVSYMVSNTHVGADGEGWQWIDNLKDDVCMPPVNGEFYPTYVLPTILHYCQFFRVGELGFQKRRIKISLFNCDKPMLMIGSRDLGMKNYKNRDGEILPLNRQQARRNAFMICTIHQSINAMVTHFKKKMCKSKPYNDSKILNVVGPDYDKN